MDKDNALLCAFDVFVFLHCLKLEHLVLTGLDFSKTKKLQSFYTITFKKDKNKVKCNIVAN